ncbi:hypothetical protein ASD52_34775 [Ensifer sp. Root142]|jgi:NurA-like 5'-3' nuclease|uniref:DUF6522 family protein n=1 Tax=Ensifer TaxID=106591 RepID=UPI00070A0745|nr:DUF6522 family protein [Ensifer sp. Root142]KQY65967.1 hypothetical protein ASD52_34775 [Ensifer sp. Root142]
MRLELDQTGDYVLDPAFLAERLSIEASELRRRMRLGLVTSIVERGVDSDAGRKRLTVRNGNSVWRGIVDADNCIVSEESLDLRRPSTSGG